MLRAMFVGLIALATLLIAAAPASAAQSSQYEDFTKCPTGAPLMNDPQYEIALCGFGSVREGSLGIGDITVQLATPVDVQFGAVSPNPELEDCSPQTCLPVVPRSTSLETDPISVTLDRRGARHGGPRWSRGDQRHGRRHRGYRIWISIEPAGDIRRVSADAIFGAPVPAYELPTKLHLRGPGLGRGCYVGSDADPIVLAPIQTSPPSMFDVLADPNGFGIETLRIGGGAAADSSFSVPGAHGCGPRLGHHRHRRGHGHRHHRRHLFDGFVERAFGLPSPAGENEATFPSNELGFAVAGYDGDPPDGGAELQAAFEAAE